MRLASSMHTSEPLFDDQQESPQDVSYLVFRGLEMIIINAALIFKCTNEEGTQLAVLMRATKRNSAPLNSQNPPTDFHMNWSINTEGSDSRR